MKRKSRKRAFSLYILIQILNVFTVTILSIGCFLIAYQAIVHIEDKIGAVHFTLYWMSTYSLALIILHLFLSKKLIEKITEPLHSLIDYMELLSKGRMETTTKPTFSTPNQEMNMLDKRFTEVINYMRQRFDNLEQEAETDPLTGLANRRTLEAVFAEIHATSETFAVLMIDIDHFKVVNDTYGHGVGDEVLCFIAQLMKNVSREQDVCCRFGGEEFIMLLAGTDACHARTVAERLREKMASTRSPTGKAVTVSIGITDNADQPHDLKILLERADIALYQAKNQGRNRTIIEAAPNPMHRS
ncbi:hypothetical protein PAECIP111891_02094 [Paenibacillus allorhizoplanae]|uniref:GGDEF domain-containing protein n=1 Tax=Paenibacillus allorhizoplanae TaxID=2905648 RepID=A0ABM9C5I4_9BACL|nr:GGDEF domain-containing protein [Paenibacillus allorhizoplanae]CAH1202262.1 hypothetical protein PAECIP111891_02094 [Paenibacillus allorhizoplanae]